MINLYVDVNEQGDITGSEAGENLIPSRQFNFFFQIDSLEVVEKLTNYHVVLNGMIPQLVLKEGE